MENIQSSLSRLNSPIGISETTGMSVYQSYTANSGINYMIGVREISDLLIVEQIAEGTTCTFLCGILLYHKHSNELIKEISVERNVHYSREKVMNLVHDALFQTFIQINELGDSKIDLISANEFLSEALEKCYFEKSRKAIIDWAKSVGILNV